MNAVIENIITRRSVKSYKQEMPPMDLIEEICKAGTYAPTGMNAQSPMILAVTNKELRDRLSRINLEIITGNYLTTSSGHNDPFYGAILKELGIEGEWEGIGNCIIGYENVAPAPQKPRKEDYIHFVK